MTIQIVEHELYKLILGLTEYDQVYPNAVIQTLNSAYLRCTSSLSKDDKLSIKSLVDNIEQGIHNYFKANPQFKRISKGVVVDMFAYHSMYFKSQYKNVYIEREVTYTAELYMERLIGYFGWLKISRFDRIDLEDRILRYNRREKKHVDVEASQELNNILNSLYKSYMAKLKTCSNLTQGNVLEILTRVQREYFPAP